MYGIHAIDRNNEFYLRKLKEVFLPKNENHLALLVAFAELLNSLLTKN